MKFIKYTFLALAIMFGGFIALGLLDAWDGPNGSTYNQKREACSRAWHDAAPGDEKRTARAMCDALGVKP